MRRLLAVAVVLAGVLGSSASSRGGLVASFGAPISQVQGNTFTFDVNVTADTDVTLYGFTIKFEIARTSATGDLTFVDPPDETFLTDGDFVLGSGASIISTTFEPPSDPPAYTSFETTVFNVDPGTILSGGSALLIRLKVTSRALPILTEDGTFTVSLVSGSYETDDLPGEITASNTQSITITPATSVVPEPSSLAASLIGLATLALWRARRRAA